jgi:hypothetical protein
MFLIQKGNVNILKCYSVDQGLESYERGCGPCYSVTAATSSA